MRITTIIGVSFTLAAGILLGWSLSTIKQAIETPVSSLQETSSTSAKSSINLNAPPTFAVIEKTLNSPHPTKYETSIQESNADTSGQVSFNNEEAQIKSAEDKKNDTSAYLEASHFQGKEETDRLVRLAALYLIEDPERSLKYLNEAALNDPKNADIQIFKASLREDLNLNQIASNDYISAVQIDPQNPYRREQLADFYLRRGQYYQALQILQDAMSAPSLDSIWLKTFFWSQLTIPLKDTWSSQEIPPGPLNDFVRYVVSLPLGIYWNQEAFEKLPRQEFLLRTRQETFWLPLLSALKNGHEEAALTLLNENTFRYSSWAPDLEKGLITLLNFRLSQKSALNKGIASFYPQEGNIESPQQLLQLLSHLSQAPLEQLPTAIPVQLQDYLQSKEAFSMLFLAVDWTEAALQFHTLEQFPVSFPGWIAESMTKALNQNRNSKTALAFALMQKTIPSLSLLTAEVALGADEKQIGFNILKEIYKNNDDSGRRAALILAKFLVEQNNFPDAKKAILAQPALATDVTAREILARIAIQENDFNQAYTLYQGLENESSEAKSFLAFKAFEDKNWSKARELTEALLKENPHNSLLKENLQTIIAEEKQKK